MTVAAERTAEVPPNRRRRMVKVLAWIAGVALFWVLLQLVGVDVWGWLRQLWDDITAIPTGYLLAGVAVQTAATFFAGFSYYGILSAAYPGEVGLWPVVAAYAVGVAMNNFLPANLGTLVTLLMFVAVIPGCTFAGSVAAYVVQKIFFTIAGTFVYLYMFLGVPGEFDLNFGNATSHPAATVLIVVGGLTLIVLLARLFWREVKKLWKKAKQGGAILSQPRRYLSRAFLPSFLSWTCGRIVTAVFLAAFSLPVTFQSVMWVTGSGSLANVTSFTPGAVGVTQATNALALKTCCHVAKSDAVAYSTAQQLIVTGWNQIVAIVLLVVVFGWTGGKALVGRSYVQAKEKSVEMKEERKQKRLAQKEKRQSS
jgi:uncharacterized membrane protein YbhN (UPF0104 family)